MPAAVLIVLCGILSAPASGGDRPSADAFDGSFRLANGPVITGGYFVEDAKGQYLYLDPEHPTRGALFERSDDRRLRSVAPAGRFEIRFFADGAGRFDRLEWQEAGRDPIPGERIHPHRSEPVSFTSSDGTHLRGRLLVPECAGLHPLVVSVHGSGPVNRYGGPYHTYFLTLGMAVLAYDKRGYTTDLEAWREPDLAALSDDAAAAVRLAAKRPDVDPDRLGLFGSSQAGWVVPRAAVEAPETDFIVLRAGAATSQLETVLHENRLELRGAGLAGLALDYAVQLRREIYGLARNGAPLDATDSLVRPYLEEPWYEAGFGQGPVSRRWSPRWWAWAQRNLGVSAEPWLARYPGPVLWFLAERDENVPLVATRAALERAFRASPGEDQEVVIVEDAAHSFLIHAAGTPPRFSTGFFAPMGRWLGERGFARGACGSR
jgi:dienelactone hydrolase